jgi:hypothetical protein
MLPNEQQAFNYFLEPVGTIINNENPQPLFRTHGALQ